VTWSLGWVSLAAYSAAGLAGGADLWSAACAGASERRTAAIAGAIRLHPTHCGDAAMDGAPERRGWAGFVGGVL